jgi:hypothetical protein
MRLSNLTTDQSNVFAMWVTVALFEYDPVTGFGKEYTNSAGEPERERAFYIIDRTVPVGFLPGEDLEPYCSSGPSTTNEDKPLVLPIWIRVHTGFIRFHPKPDPSCSNHPVC